MHSSKAFLPAARRIAGHRYILGLPGLRVRMPIPYHIWSPFTTVLLDPFVLFCLGCLVTPLLVVSTVDESSAPLGTLDLRAFDPELWKAYWSDTAVLCGGAFAALAVLIASDFPALSNEDTRAANWFLANGAIIHVAMDGMTGGFNFLPAMGDNYKQLDNRALGFDAVGTAGLTEDAVAVASVVFRAELFVMAPLCFLTYVSYYSRSTYCPALALITLSAQLWGTVMFVGPELMTGCKNMVPIGVDGCSAGYSPYELLFFWFAVGANFLWIVKPLQMMLVVASAIASTAQRAADAPVPGRPLLSGPGRGSLRSQSVSPGPGARPRLADPPADTAAKVAPGQWWPGSHGDADTFFSSSGGGAKAKTKAKVSRARSPSASPAGRGKSKSKSRSPSPVARRTRKSVSAKKKA